MSQLTITLSDGSKKLVAPETTSLQIAASTGDRVAQLPCGLRFHPATLRINQEQRPACSH